MPATSGSEWRKAEEITLPSGNVALLRKPDVLAMIMQDGEIPDFMTDLVMQNFETTEQRQARAARTIEPMTETQLKDVIAYLNTVIRAAFVSPCIVDKPEDQMGDNEIGLAHVSLADRLFVADWVQGGEESQEATRFLAQQGASLESLRAVSEVLPDPGAEPGDQ